MSSLAATHLLDKEKTIFSFHPTPHYPRCIILSFKINNIDLSSKDISIEGFAEVFYKEAENKGGTRYFFTKDDLIAGYSIKLNVGDLIENVRVHISSNYSGNNEVVLERTIKEVFEASTIKEFSKAKFSEAASGPFPNFVEYIRGIPAADFVNLLKNDFEFLKDAIKNSANKVLLEWAITDWMIFFAGTGKLPTDLLDLATENYAESFDVGNKKLGVNLESEEQEAENE
jgi:hypothetical protein